MIAGELRSRIDAIWNAFWSGSISNPLEVIEQLTYLLFIKGLDEAQTRAERKANRTGQPIEDPIFRDGEFRPDEATKPRPYDDLRWSSFRTWLRSSWVSTTEGSRSGCRRTTRS
jgi:type I restriction enzyme M protein